MAKFRARTKTGKNRQRWKKGQSSSSNPSKTKHRDAAKSRLLRVGFGVPEAPKNFDGPARLTAESLLKHDALMGNVSTIDEGQDDALTLGQTNKTFDTFASSVWSNCSNISFGKMLPRFNPSNPKHKEMLAILSAISEVIKENRMTESDEEPSNVEYFAALLTSLDAIELNLESLSATISLLSIIIKTVNRELLQSKFSDSATLLLKLLSLYVQSEDASVVRGLIGCLSILLRAQDKEAWTHESTTRVMESILSFVVDARPKIRKAAQHAICVLFASKPDGLEFHPGSGRVADFLIKSIEDNVAKNEKAVLHILILLKEILCHFPKQQVKRTCDTIVGVMTMGNRMSLSCGFQAIHGLFAGRPSMKSLPGDLNARLITALYNFQPAMDDSQPSVAWLTVMQEAHVNLANLDIDLCVENLSKFFNKASRYWVNSGDVAVAATTAMKAVMNEAVRPHLDSISKESNYIKEMFRCIENGLKYEFHQSWAQVLNLLTTFFDVCGEKYSHIVGNCLQALADLRSSSNFAFTNELDYVIGKAVRTMGPEVVLSHIPLDITGNEENYDFPKSWLLPVLRENVQNTNLGYFKTHLLPVAKRCQERSLELSKKDDKIGKKSYEMLSLQIWSLLPGFCNNPKDFSISFGAIVKDLGTNLSDRDRKDLRMYILASLRQLLLKSCNVQENRDVLSKFAKRFMKALYNIYTVKPVGAEESGQRSSVIETIKLFHPLLDQKEQGDVFTDVLNKYEDGKNEQFVKDACHDLLRAGLRYQGLEQIGKMYRTCTLALTDKDHKKQKKAYKMLEEICSSPSNESNCQEFLSRNLGDIQKTLLASLSKASAPSQASRLRCLTNIVRALENNNEEFAYKVVPEAILCVKAANEKARSGAYLLLVVIGEALQRWKCSEPVDDVLKDYMKVILAGLAGGPTMIHCTLKAITRVYYEFRDLFPDDLTEMLIENVCLLITSQSREVVNPSVSFLHVFITTCPVMESAKFCEKIVAALCKMTEDCKRHFRLKTRYLYDRLVRKFGFDVVKALVPKDDEMTHKRLKNIRKMQAKKKKSADELEDSDDDDEFRIKSKPKTIDEILSEAQDSDNEMETEDNKRVQVRKKKKSATYIAEDGEAIVDFLDPSASQKLRSSKPNANPMTRVPKARKEEFEIAPDGRLIIRDSEDDDEEEVKKPKGYDLNDSDEENGETFDSMVSTNARKRKRGTSIASSKRSEPAMKYQAGGTGIHRPLDANSKSAVKEYGAEYKAKKAKGDMKRKGKPDPYAYVPLQKSSLNRRKKAKFEGQFKNLVKAANTGSAKGKKAKNLTNRLKNVKI